MNTKNNQRTKITKKLIKQAYLQLLNEKQNGKITIKDICERAEINRSTFYLHYSEPNGILWELEDETIGKMQESLLTIAELELGDRRVQVDLTTWLHYIHKHEELFQTLLIRNSDPHFRQKMLEVAEEIVIRTFDIPLPAELQKPVYHFVVSGAMDLICDWIRSDFRMSEQQFSNLLYTLNMGAIGEAFIQKDKLVSLTPSQNAGSPCCPSSHHPR